MSLKLFAFISVITTMQFVLAVAVVVVTVQQTTAQQGFPTGK